MNLIDLEIHINNWRKLNKTRRTINVFLNEIDYNIVLYESMSDLPIEIFQQYKKSISYTGVFLFQSVCIKVDNGIKFEQCYINSDCGSNISKVLTENERIIKDIIE
jgi:hypothetical protein